ncbi:MAG: PD-(D/E)XK nuclease family protein [Planctomycetota bacterium]
MADLTQHIKPESETVQAIYRYHESKRETKPRTYLGASQIGHACSRALWYSFRHCGGAEFNGRMLRLFETGDLAEPRFVAELRAIGCEVYDVDPETGKQFEVKSIGGHFSGHMDGCARGLPEAPEAWHVLEFKTHNAKSFADLKNKGVRDSKPMHFAQMLVYMALTGMRRALYLAVNKDTDELYSERVRFEERKHGADWLLNRAAEVINAKQPPARISDNRDHPACRWCEHKPLCHGTDDCTGPAVPCSTGCRTCVHATPQLDTDHGRWSCDKHRISLTVEGQAAGCKDHLFIPGLVTFAEVVDAGYSPDGDWTEYRNADGTTWRNSRQGSDYSSAELAKLPGPMVGAGVVDDLKGILGAEVDRVELAFEGDATNDR